MMEKRLVAVATMPARHTFYLWRDLAVHIGPGMASDPHRHFATQICLGIDGPFSLRAGRAEPWGNHGAALIPSGVMHQTGDQPATLAMIYFDPISPFRLATQAWANGAGGGLASLPASAAGAAVGNLQAAGERPAAIRHAVETLLAAPEPETGLALEPRIALALRRLASQPDAPPALPELAAQVGLSASRFRHLFRDQMGSTLSAYRLWNRVVHSCRLLATRPELTWAAHEAGFADSAHFSRAFHRTFGLTPSDVFKSGRVSLVVCA